MTEEHPIDPQDVRREVYSTMHSLDRMRASEAYWHVGAVVNGVRQTLDQAWALIDADDGRNALAVLRAITQEYLREWENLDDSDGEASDFFSDLGPVWIEALLSTDLTDKERQKWADRLTKWQGEIDAYGVDDAFGSAATAALQGWDYPPLQRVLQGTITEHPGTAWALPRISLPCRGRKTDCRIHYHASASGSCTRSYHLWTKPHRSD